ncbi:MAG: hypothetical protein B6U69_02570 [Thermofilum sp. ex4484_15]|nr:MAG: hypothetical protein B6U69_02570 [Thermofilum sp. ex4484_15]
MAVKDFYKGITKIRKAFLMQMFSYLISLITLLSLANLRLTPPANLEDITSKLPYIAAIGLALLTLFIVALISWIYKIMGWGDLCKSSLGRKFYCIVRICIIALPIISFALAIIIGVEATFKALIQGTVTQMVYPGFTSLVNTIFYSTFIIEGIALLDLYLKYGPAYLGMGSILYLIFTIIGVFLQGFRLHATLIANSIGCISALLIFLGLTTLRSKVISLGGGNHGGKI